MKRQVYQHTKYEKARIIGARSLQIAMGAPTLLDESPDRVDPVDMAISEYENHIIPITVRRISR